MLGSVIPCTSGSTDGFGELGLHTDCDVDSLEMGAFVFKQIKYLLLCLVTKALSQYPITYPCNPFVIAASVTTSQGEIKANLCLEMVGSFTSSARHRLGAFCALSHLTYHCLKDHRCRICTIFAFLPLFPYHLPNFASFPESLESAWAWEGLLEQDNHHRKWILCQPFSRQLFVPSFLLGHQTPSHGLFLHVPLPRSSCIQGMSQGTLSF